MKNPSHLILIIVGTLLSITAWGQESKKYSGDYADFYRAEQLYEKQQYSAAMETFSTFMEEFDHPEDPQYVKASYYNGISALMLYNRNAVKLLMDFINEYPESIYLNTIYYKLGTYFYKKKKYKDTKKWLEKTDLSELDSSDFAAYHFKLGYADFQLGKNADARNEFFEIKDGTSNYSAPALYYYSYIEYKEKAYQEALNGFLALRETPTFSKEVKKYIIQIYYLLGNYDKVTEYAPKFSSKNGIDGNSAEMNLLIGQAYYKIQKYDEAVPFLENYYKRKKTTREEDYALGYSYLKTGKYKAAIPLFDYVTQKKDKLSQIAYYHIAQCYVKEDKLNYASTAFKSAAELPIDPKIQEDALYHYAVLSYKLDYNPYNEAIKSFELFLKKFPNSKRKKDVYNYLVNVYSSTKNYKEALASLDRIPQKNIKLKITYQIVSFNMGIKEYEQGHYQACIAALNGVYKYDVNPSVTGKAKYWQADSYYMLQDWADAVKTYRAFLGIPGVNNEALKESAYYNIAYVYFMQEDWTQAIVSFRTFTQLNNIQDQKKLADAYVRLGDCYYTKDQPNLQRAAESYQKSLKYDGKKKDLVLFSLAKVYKLIPGEIDKEINSLNDLLDEFPHSSFEIKAIFELGDAYKRKGDYEHALLSYQKIVKSFPSNSEVKNALIGIGDIKLKQEKYSEAESYFRRVLDEYTLDDETCKTVTQSLVDIYRLTLHQEKIAKLGEKYPCSGISKNDEELFFYQTASELYVNKKYKKAVPEIKKYLHHYPDGKFSTQLMSYLADIFYQGDEKDSAFYYYKIIVHKPQSSYTEQALIRASKYLYNHKKYDEAQPYYQQLAKVTSDPQVLFNTYIGLMRTNYLTKNYSQAAPAAKKVLDNDLLDKKDIKIEGNYIAGMSYFYLGEYTNSIANLRWTADNTGKERGTEALYTLSKSYYELGNYDKSEKIHTAIMKRKPAYDYWIAKSLILQAQVFEKTGDLFQAEQTINLVISNYPKKDDDILTEAQKVKEEILHIKDQPKDVENNKNRTIDINDKGNDKGNE